MPDGSLIHAPLGCCDTQKGLLPLAEARATLLAGVRPVARQQSLAPAAALGRILAAAPREGVAAALRPIRHGWLRAACR